mmetsp:Transcript_74935/g.242300  ORF Transcript_74935/g.242300 Transcript_74935/m.242300 type:complete len:232 (+) Transcript_74935:3474-4169(+)
MPELSKLPTPLVDFTNAFLPTPLLAPTTLPPPKPPPPPPPKPPPAPAPMTALLPKPPEDRSSAHACRFSARTRFSSPLAMRISHRTLSSSQSKAVASRPFRCPALTRPERRTFWPTRTSPLVPTGLLSPSSPVLRGAPKPPLPGLRRSPLGPLGLFSLFSPVARGAPKLPPLPSPAARGAPPKPPLPGRAAAEGAGRRALPKVGAEATLFAPECRFVTDLTDGTDCMACTR